MSMTCPPIINIDKCFHIFVAFPRDIAMITCTHRRRADMNPKMVLTVIGSFQVALAGGIFFNAGALASEGISEISDQTLWLASQFVEVMAAMSLGTGIVYLLSSGYWSFHLSTVVLLTMAMPISR